jgi:hypothetical protein
MDRKENLLSIFETNYFKVKKHHFYKPKHREFLYDSIVNNIYNTELVLCIAWIKPVSRFVADKIEHIEFLRNYLKEKWLFLEYRELKSIEDEVNLNNKINFIIYIWKEKVNVKKAIEYDETWSWDIWELLGYPKCCSEKWKYENVKKDLEFYKNNTNEYFKNYLNSSKYPTFNNPFFNFTSNSLSFFYPCSIDCENALELHKRQSNIIKNDNETFYKNTKSYFSLPILFLFPEKNDILTTTLHFDEVFRIYFVWFKKWDIIFYKDFFILSYAFLDQKNNDYKIDAFELLEKLILWNKIHIEKENIIIKWLNYKNTHKIKNFAKIINFS